MNIENLHFKASPSVWATGKNYQIIVAVKASSLMWVEVDGNQYFDHSNGVMCSDTLIHKIAVPMEVLDKAKAYTVCYRIMLNRVPYDSDTGDEQRQEYKFRPLKEGDLNIYHISDAHNAIKAPVAAGKYFGDKLDLLVMNGDIPDDSSRLDNVDNIYIIAGNITNGEIPVIFSRGNHDMRGFYAEKFAQLTPTDNGLSYFTVRMGDLWCLIMDAGEDKNDDVRAYGHTICCHHFRLQQTKFLENVIKNADKEYNAKGVKKRVVISHAPFTALDYYEKEVYNNWVKLIDENICPDFYLCGHLHTCEVIRPGDEKDKHNQKCPTVVGSVPGKDGLSFTGAAIEYGEKITVNFTNDNCELILSVAI